MSNKKIKRVMNNFVQTQKSDEGSFDYMAKTINSLMLKESNEKIDELSWDFLVNPVSCFYQSSEDFVANRPPDCTLVKDNRKNVIQSGRFLFVCPRTAVYCVSIFANTTGSAGQWIARSNQDYILCDNTENIRSVSRDIFLKKGDTLTIINTVDRTLVSGTIFTVSIQQRGL